jgi:hypothetical protein
MNGMQATSARAKEPTAALSQRSSIEEDNMSPAVPDIKSKRLRNWVLFGNAIAWVLIILTISWLVN